MQVSFVSQTAAALPQDELQHMSHGQLVQAANVLHAGWTTASRQVEQVEQKSRRVVLQSQEEREAGMRMENALETRIRELERELASEKFATQSALSKVVRLEAATTRSGASSVPISEQLLQDELLMAKADVVRMERLIRQQKKPDVRILEHQVAALERQRANDALELQRMAMEVKSATTERDNLRRDLQALKLQISKPEEPIPSNLMSHFRQSGSATPSLVTDRSPSPCSTACSATQTVAWVLDAPEILEVRSRLQSALNDKLMLEEKLQQTLQQCTALDRQVQKFQQPTAGDLAQHEGATSPRVADANEDKDEFEVSIRETYLQLMDKLAHREEVCSKLQREATLANDRSAQLEFDLAEAAHRLEIATHERHQLEQTVSSLTALSQEELEGLVTWQEELRSARRQIKLLERDVQLNASSEAKLNKVTADNLRLQLRLERCQEELSAARIELDELHQNRAREAARAIGTAVITRNDEHDEQVPRDPAGIIAEPVSMVNELALKQENARILELLFLVSLRDHESAVFEHRSLVTEEYSIAGVSLLQRVCDSLRLQARREVISANLELAAAAKQASLPMVSAVAAPAAPNRLSSKGPSLGLGLAQGQGMLLVESVAVDSPAYNAGMKAGDVLVAVNRRRVKTLDEVSDVLANWHAPSAVLTVCPGGPLFSEEEVHVSLGA